MAEITLREHLQEVRNDELAKLIYEIGRMSMDIRVEFPHRMIAEKGEKNKYGELAEELDVWCNKYYCDGFKKTGLVRAVYSEELKNPVRFENDAPFVITIDPLDGSSNVISNNVLGAIIGIYRKDLPAKGRELVASMYKLYGPMTTLVYTAGRGVHEFVKHRKGVMRYCLIHENMKLPEPGKVYGMGGSPTKWIPEFKEFVKGMSEEKKMKLRYCGTFVGDIAQVLHYGGFFGYPALVDKPQGKLRLFYEGIPMGNIIEAAGGLSSNGELSLLDIGCDDADVRCPIYIGNRDLVLELEGKLKK
ncbi:MAG: class 1 fructose-bisphosphatase [Candidatus Micrarchaeota archaeon]